MSDPIGGGSDSTRGVSAEARGLGWRLNTIRQRVQKRLKKLARQALAVGDLENIVYRANLTEAAHIELWMEELKRQGYTEFYAHPIKEGPRAGELPLGTKAYGSDGFGKVLEKAYPTGGGPDLVATGRKKILVGDVVAGEWSETTMAYQSGQPYSVAQSDVSPTGGRRVIRVHHLDKTKRDAHRLYAVLPDEYMRHKVEFRDRYYASTRKQSRRVRVRPNATGGRPTDVDRGLRKRSTVPADVKPKFPRARVVRPGVSAGFAHGATVFRARSAAIGVKAWRATRVIAGTALKLFVPFRGLEIALEIALAIWDRQREEKERKSRERRRALAEVLSQKEEEIAQLIQSKVLSDASRDRLLAAWEGGKNPGFLYARVNALVEIETYEDRRTRTELENLTAYRVIDIDVVPTMFLFDFDFEDVEGEQVSDPTEEEQQQLIRRGAVYPFLLQKRIRRRRLRHTILPPAATPFDIVVAKLNNLFLDTLMFVIQFEGLADDVVENFRFDYKSEYDERIKLHFPRPLRASNCHYCLRYLHWAAKQLSGHPLAQEDIRGNLENPVKGWQRRRKLLGSVYTGEGTTYRETFSGFARKMALLIDDERLDPAIEADTAALYEGAQSIWRDLRRMDRFVGTPEYFYYGPDYPIPDF